MFAYINLAAGLVQQIPISIKGELPSVVGVGTLVGVVVAGGVRVIGVGVGVGDGLSFSVAEASVGVGVEGLDSGLAMLGRQHGEQASGTHT